MDSSEIVTPCRVHLWLYHAAIIMAGLALNESYDDTFFLDHYPLL